MEKLNDKKWVVNQNKKDFTQEYLDGFIGLFFICFLLFQEKIRILLY